MELGSNSINQGLVLSLGAYKKTHPCLFIYLEYKVVPHREGDIATGEVGTLDSARVTVLSLFLAGVGLLCFRG